MTLRLSSTNTGDQPEPDWWTPSPSQPIILWDWCLITNLKGESPWHTGATEINIKHPHCQILLGGKTPRQSGCHCTLSNASLQSNIALFVRHKKRCFTFPERTSTMFLTASRFLAMRSTSGSGAAGPAEAQMAWFGHPAQAAAWKAKVHGFRRNCSTEVYFATLFCPSARASLWRWFY